MHSAVPATPSISTLCRKQWLHPGDDVVQRLSCSVLTLPASTDSEVSSDARTSLTLYSRTAQKSTVSLLARSEEGLTPAYSAKAAKLPGLSPR